MSDKKTLVHDARISYEYPDAEALWNEAFFLYAEESTPYSKTSGAPKRFGLVDCQICVQLIHAQLRQIVLKGATFDPA